MLTPEEILKKYWGYDSFRPLQLDIINSILNKNNTLALLPTGGGKSVCFQVPALINEGICIVVSPLIALMKDQVFQLTERGIPAAAVYSGMHYSEIDQALDDGIYNGLKFLYVSPERLKTELFIVRAKQMKISFLAIDEAHCISKWGYDFRPAYLAIKEFLALIPDIKTIALTATATTEVKNDIIKQLKLVRPKVFVQSFARKNLSYSVAYSDFKEDKVVDILNRIAGTSIIYVKTRKKTVEVAKALKSKGIVADYYHAGLELKERNKKQDDWISDKIRVIVSTNAFGMGIDKADVRSVIHLDLCENMEAYYQESGRAGRDNEKAYAISLYNSNDIDNLGVNLELKYPELVFVKKVYQSLCNYYKLAIGSQVNHSFDFDIHEFSSTFGINPKLCHYALKLLENQGLVYFNDAYFNPSKLKIICSPKELYAFQIRNVKYDRFIKTILRIYGGEIFANFINISELEIGNACFTPQNDIREMLAFLNNQKIIIYEAQNSKSQMGFLTPRQDAENLPFNHKEIELRKQADIKALNSIKKYTSEELNCRMLMIQDYFDEVSTQRCGICDNCVKLKKRGLEPQLLEEYYKKILTVLPYNFSKLQEIEYFDNKELLVKIIRFKLESEDLAIDEFGLLYKN